MAQELRRKTDVHFVEAPEAVVEAVGGGARWVRWRWAWRGKTPGGKRTKPPLALNGRYAENDDPATWGEIDDALDAMRKNPEAQDGLGLMLLGLKDIFTIDLDNCVNPETGAIARWAQKIVKSAGSYTELTPSGYGLRIIGLLPGSPPRLNRLKLPARFGGHPEAGVELYTDAAVYITLTGRQISDTPELQDIRETVARIDAWEKETDAPCPSAPSLSASTAASAPQAGGGPSISATPAAAPPPLEVVQDALRYVSPDLGYGDWVRVLQSVHSAYPGPEGLSVADGWSSQGEKYVPGEVAKKWDSFSEGGGLGIGTLVHMAQQNGWAGDPSAAARLRTAALDRVANSIFGGRAPQGQAPQGSAHQGPAMAHSAALSSSTISGAVGSNVIGGIWGDGSAAAPDPNEPDNIEDLFGTWRPIDEAKLPARQFVYGTHYVREFASVTVAPGGLGKSTLVMTEAVAMAVGEPLLGVSCQPRRVLYFNAEDPRAEIERRILAICGHFDVDQRELTGQLFYASGRDMPIVLAEGDRGDVSVAWFDRLERYAKAVGVDAIILDPLANMVWSPENNEVFSRLGSQLSDLASRTGTAVEVVHHTRKLNGQDAVAEDSRGGIALIGAVRSSRVLNPMKREEAEEAGLKTHVHHFRVDDGKMNLAPRSEKATWFSRTGVILANGDNVGVVEQWDWPDAFDGVSMDAARRVQMAIRASGEEHLANPKASNWVGVLVAELLEIDLDDTGEKKRVSTMVSTWIRNGVLRKETRMTGARKRQHVVVAGENNLATER